jgi:hypothetical protein
MKHLPLIISLAAIACTDPELDSDVEVGTSQVEPVCSAADDGDRFPSTPVINANLSCTDAGCTLILPASIPGRQQDTLAAHADIIITPGNESFEYVIASSHGVTSVNLGIFAALHIGDDGLVWFPLDEELVAMAPDGQVALRCTVPPAIATVAAVTHIADTVWVAGVNEDNRGELWKLDDNVWQEQATGVAAQRFVPYRERQVIALAYGYAEVHDPTVNEGVQIGGSDDDFSAAAICSDESYWIGGQTGLYMYCTSEHQCERTTEGDYPFQSTSYGCDSDNRLWWFEPGNEADSPVIIGTVTPEGLRGEAPLDPSIRHRRSQAGRTWEVVDAE